MTKKLGFSPGLYQFATASHSQNIRLSGYIFSSRIDVPARLMSASGMCSSMEALAPP